MVAPVPKTQAHIFNIASYRDRYLHYAKENPRHKKHRGEENILYNVHDSFRYRFGRIVPEDQGDEAGDRTQKE